MINQEWMAERHDKMLAAFAKATIDAEGVSNAQEVLDDILEQCAMTANSQYFGAKSCALLRSLKSK